MTQLQAVTFAMARPNQQVRMVNTAAQQNQPYGGVQ
jgi:hypothetical protein